MFIMLKPFSDISHNMVTSTLLLSPLLHFEEWRRLSTCFDTKIYESRLKKILTVSTVFGYMAIILAEGYNYLVIMRLSLFGFYPWINYHFGQILYYFILYMLKYLVMQTVKKYNDFKIEINTERHVPTQAQLKCELRRKFCYIASSYRDIYEEVILINGIFNWLLFAAITGLFLNILCTTTYAFINFEENLPIISACSCIQIVTSLVSCKVLPHIIGKLYLANPIPNL